MRDAMRAFWGRYAAQWVALLIALIYLALILVILPPQSFFSADSGMKYLQILNLAHNPPSIAIAFPGSRLTDDARFQPWPGYVLRRDGSYYSVFSLPYAALCALLYRVFGVYGPYLLSAASAFGVALITFHIGRTLWDRMPVPDLLVAVAMGTPLFFYGVELWEHALGTLLSVASICLIWGTVRRASRQDAGSTALLWAGLLAAVGAWMRSEIYMLILAEGAALTLCVAAAGRRQALLRYAAGALAGLLPLWMFNAVLYGNPIGPHIMISLNMGIQTTVSWQE